MLAEATFKLVAQPNPLRAELLHGDVAVGCTLADLGAGDQVPAWVNGARCEDAQRQPQAGDEVVLRAMPAGFVGDILGDVGGLLLAPFVYLNDALVGFVLDGVAGLIPLPSIDLESSSALKPFGNAASTNNRGTPYGPVHRTYGTHRIFPPLASKHYTEQSGPDQWLRMLFDLGYGPLDVDADSIKIGDTLLSEFEHEKEILQGEGGDPALTLFTRNVVETTLSDGFNLDDDTATRTTELGTVDISLDIGAPALIRRNDDGKPRWVKVAFRVEYRATGSGDPFTNVVPAPGVNFYGDGSWGPVAGTVGNTWFLYGQGSQPYRVNFLIRTPTPGQYDVRVTRTSMEAQNVGQQIEPIDEIASEFRWTAIRSFGADIAQTAMPGRAMLALRIKITDQLGSVVDNLSLVVSSKLQTWNGSAWVLAVSSNPAWVYRDILMGSANARPLPGAKVDDDALIAWAAECVSAEREFNGVFDGRTTVFEALKSVALAGRAAFQISNGRYSVVRDMQGLVPVQMFTPRNAWAFQGTRNYIRRPHALQVKFKNRDADWLEDLLTVYADGYSADGAGGTEVATDFEQLSLFGFTDPDHVFAEARYRMAVAELRPETFTWTADVENLVCQRGKVVRFQHDAILVGLGAGRIKAIDGADVTLDEAFVIEGGKTYQLRIRKDDATSSLSTVTTGAGTWNTLTLDGGVPAGVQVGDLAAFGESGKVTLDLLVTGIQPAGDLRATLTAVPYAPEVHDPGPIPPYDPLITQPPLTPPEPVFLNVLAGPEAALRNFATALVPRIVATYLFPAAEVSVPEVELAIRRTDELQFRIVSRSANTGTAVWELSEADSDRVIRLRGISNTGVRGPWAEQSVPATDAVPEPLGGITLLEQPNNPATPNQDLSTVVATVAPPAGPSNYSHSIVEYRRLSQAEWFRVGPTDELGQARQVLNADGTAYRFRARAVSDTGYEDTGGPTADITLSVAGQGVPVTDPDADAPTDAALNVANLRLQGELVAVTDFTGTDPVLEWDAVTPPAGQTLRDYRVAFVDPVSGQVLRYRYVVERRCTYPLYDNLTDSIDLGLGYTAPRRQFEVRVIARTAQGFISAAAASKTIQNPAPVLPGDFTRTPYGGGLELRFSRPSDGDYARTVVYASQTNGFTPGPGNVLYDGLETTPIHLEPLAAGTWYTRLLLFDVFGPGTISDQYTDVIAGDPANDITPPTAPSGLVLSSNVQAAELWTMANLNLSWSPGTDNSGLLYYEVQIWLTSAPGNITTEFTSTTTFTLVNVQAGANYSAKVRSVDYSGNVSAFTATGSHTVAGDNTPPSNVAGVSGAGGLDKIVLDWFNPTDPDWLYTKVYRGTFSGFSVAPGTFKGDVRDAVFVDSEVVNGTSYYYKFVTVDNSGNQSAPSTGYGPYESFKISAANVAAYFESAAIGNAYIQNLDAVKVTTGTLNSDRIGSNSITAIKLNVSQLSAISADMGSLTAGTITGAIVRTSAGTSRVELSSVGLREYNGAGNIVAQLGVDGNGFLGLSPGNIQWDSGGGTTISGQLSMAGTGSIVMSGGAIRAGKTSYANNTAGYWMGFDGGVPKFRMGTATNSFQWTGSEIELVGGAIFSGKTTYASTTAGYWIGLDGGTPKLHVGNSTNSINWNGSSLTVQGVIQTAGSGQRVVLTSGNETEFYDDFGTVAGTIGIRVGGEGGGDEGYVVGGLPHFGTLPGNSTQRARTGVAGFSGTGSGVFGRSTTGTGVFGVSNSGTQAVLGKHLGSGAGVLGTSSSGNGVSGSGQTGVYGVGSYGLVGEQTANATGGSIWLRPDASSSAAPTHSALSGTICVRYPGGVCTAYMQTAGGFLGSGSTWVALN